jgi:hypothetical protein
MNKNYTFKDDGRPSEMFLDAFTHGVGSDEMTCDFCGKLHLCPDNDYADRDIDDKQSFREWCEAEKKLAPDKVTLHYNVDSVMGHDLAGRVFVVECDCDGPAKYENFIWAERDIIRRYLKIRIDQELKWAESERLLNVLAGIEDEK